MSAAREILVQHGFQGFGINAVARAAGCDKQLIYRYFGGLDGLAEAIGESVAEDLAARLGEHALGAVAVTYVEHVERLLLGLVDVLRSDPLLQRILAWELSDRSPMVSRFAAGRSKVLMAWAQAGRALEGYPQQIDVPAHNAVLIAAIQHLVLQSAATGGFAAIALDDHGWERISATIRQLVRAAYALPGDSGGMTTASP